MVWEVIFLLVILKIPIIYLCCVVWYAIKAEPKPPPDRVTLTLPKLNASHRILLVVSGAEKAPMLARVIAGPDPEVPASLLHRARLEIIADAAALDG